MTWITRPFPGAVQCADCGAAAYGRNATVDDIRHGRTCRLRDSAVRRRTVRMDYAATEERLVRRMLSGGRDR